MGIEFVNQILSSFLYDKIERFSQSFCFSLLFVFREQNGTAPFLIEYDNDNIHRPFLCHVLLWPEEFYSDKWLRLENSFFVHF